MSGIWSWFSGMFAHPWIAVAGAIGMLAPILIHLLNRRRFKVLDWAAMQFLLESVRKNRRRLRLEELLLLLLRCLICLILGASLARLTGCSDSANIVPAGLGGSQSVAFVIDDSYSSNQKLGSGTILSTSTADIVARVKQLRQSDRVAIIRASGPGEPEAVFGPNYITEPESLVGQLETMEASDGRADLAAAIEKSAETFEGREGLKRLYVYGDFRRVDLAEPAQAEALAKAFDRVKKAGAQVVMVDYGRDCKTNLTIEDLRMLDKYAVANAPVRVALKVRNNGSNTAEAVTAKVRAKLPTEDGLVEAELPDQVIGNIEPGASRQVEFTVKSRHAGPAVVTAELTPDELETDSKRHLALDVREALKLLVVDGRRDISEPEESEAFFVKFALDPRDDQRHGVKPTVIPTDALDDVDIDEYDLVCLLNVSEFPLALDEKGDPVYPQVRQLEQYVRDGGGLVIFTGDQVNLSFYNGPLYEKGKGLIPFRVLPPKRLSVGDQPFGRLDPQSISGNRLMGMFQAAGGVLTRVIRFETITPAEEATAPAGVSQDRAPRVLARFTGEPSYPAVAERRMGDGVVVMFYSTAHKRWNDFPVARAPWMLFPTFWLEYLIPYTARAQEQELTAEVGAPLAIRLNEDTRDAAFTLRLPDWPETPEQTLVADQNQRDVLPFDKAVQAGLYDVTGQMLDGTTEKIVLARNVDPTEGDLAPGHEEMIATAVNSKDFVYIDRTGRDVAVDAGKTEDQSQWWVIALAALLVLMALETFLGQRFGHYNN